MSMNTCIVGFIPPDAKWKKMKVVWDSCSKAGITPPKEVDDFFNGVPPDDAGVEIELEEHPSCQEYRDEMREGFQVEVSKLPKNVRFIRFYNSY